MKARYRQLNFSAHRIKIRIEGFRIDRLVDKAMKGGLDLRNITMLSHIEAVCWVTPEDLRELKKLAKALYRISEEERRGMEYRAKSFIKAPIKAVGALLVLAMVISQSFFVKTIEVSGYKAIPETLLLQCLAEAGVEEGAYRPRVDWQEAEERLYEAFPQITWLKLAYDGRKVFLEISEAENPMASSDGEKEGGLFAPSDSKAQKKYTNIVAAESGYVEEISTYRGLALVEEGDYVKKGQVLVSGYVPTEPTVYDENWPKHYYVRCSGLIWAKVPYRLTFHQERYAKGEAQGDRVVSKRQRTEEEIAAEAERSIRQWVKENLPEKAQILNKDLNFYIKENIIEIGVTLEVRRQIGEEQEILIGEKSTDTSGD